MMKFELRFSRRFMKDFSKLDSATQSGVLVVLEKMRSKPLKDVKKLKNVKIGVFRRRIGDYRLRFDLIKGERMVFLYRIRHRKDVYKF